MLHSRRFLYNRFISATFLSTVSLCLSAQSWLPQQQDPSVGIRLLSCHYDGPLLKSCSTINEHSDEWALSTGIDSVAGGKVYTFTALKSMDNVGVAVAFDVYNWSSDNYVMIPASVYNGNRQRIVNRQYATGLDRSEYYWKELAMTSTPLPQLSPYIGEKSRIEVSVCNASTPVITYYKRHSKEGVFLFTDQGINWENKIIDNALIVEEAPDRSMATFVISAPGVRERKPLFIGFTDSPDRGISVKAGDKISIRVDQVQFKAPDVPSFISRFFKERKHHNYSAPVRDLIPMSQVFSMMKEHIDSRYLNHDTIQFYRPENADWMSYGWIGGLLNTFPMIAVNDELHLNRVCRTFDFGLSHGYGKSGYFNDVVGADGKIVYRDAIKLNPETGLTRKNADLLYWMIKQFQLMRLLGHGDKVAPEWESRIQTLADAFVSTWQKEGTWGNYLNLDNGSVAVYNTMGGSIAIAGLVLASKYYHKPKYLEVAKAAADFYYQKYATVGYTSGACGDILQNAESETAIALTTSMMTLYEATGERRWLEHCENLAALSSTWTVSFKYQLPKETPLGKLDANLTGAVWASTQNKHGAPGFCTQSGDALFKLYRITGDTLYANFLRDVIHAHAEGIQLPTGKITERLTYCDADSRGDRWEGGYEGTGWNETNGAMMALEIPGIYVRTDKATAFAFDHVIVKDIKRKNKGVELSLVNPTKFDAVVTILAEDKEAAAKPLGDNAFVHWNLKVKIKAGQSKTVRIK
ncbi:MAG: hypothetical protein ACOYJG_11695 [Prevotella sp.]